MGAQRFAVEMLTQIQSRCKLLLPSRKFFESQRNRPLARDRRHALAQAHPSSLERARTRSARYRSPSRKTPRSPCAPDSVESSFCCGYLVRAVGGDLFKLEFTRQCGCQLHGDRLLALHLCRFILDVRRLLAPRQKVHAEDVVRFCPGRISLVLL